MHRRLAPLLVAACLSGCLHRGDVDLLEAQLRRQQDQLTSDRRHVDQLQQELSTARREADELRRRLADSRSSAPQEFTEPLARVAGVQFHSLLTGARDTDQHPGDDALVAILTPVDSDGDLVKLSGRLELEALDLARSGEDQRVGRWEFSVDEARELWHSGFLAAGYQIEVPISQPPEGASLLLHGRLIATDGRQFDASCTVPIDASPRAEGENRSEPSPGFLAPPPAGPLGDASSPRSAAMPVSTRQAASGAPATSALAPGEALPALPHRDRSVRAVDHSESPVGKAALDDADEDDAPTGRAPNDDAPAGRALIDESPTGRAPLDGASQQESAEAPPRRRPRPFPDGLKTSDNWTDATIPTLR